MTTNTGSSVGVSFRVLLAFAMVLIVGEATHAQVHSDPDPEELWGVEGEYFYEEIRPFGTPGGPPNSMSWRTANAPPPSGLTVSVAPGTQTQWEGVKIEGVPTAAGFYSYSIYYHTYRIGSDIGLNLIIFKTAEDRDAVADYTELLNGASGLDRIYWSALRGYFIGTGVGDEGLALYSYYATLGEYYYGAYVSSYPQWAAFYYWYYRGLGAYYYYDKHGDRATAESQFAYYVGLANGSL